MFGNIESLFCFVLIFIVSLMCLFTFLWGWFLESGCCWRKEADSYSLEIGPVLASLWTLRLGTRNTPQAPEATTYLHIHPHEAGRTPWKGLASSRPAHTSQAAHCLGVWGLLVGNGPAGLYSGPPSTWWCSRSRRPALAEGLHWRGAVPAGLISSTGPSTLDLVNTMKGKE